MRFLHNKKRQRGVALIIVLWMSVALTLMVTSFINITRTAVATAGAETNLMLHNATVDSALEYTVYRLLDRKTKTKWLKPDLTQRVRLNNRTVNIRIVDPKGLIDINRADTNILWSFFQRITGSRTASDEITKQILAKRAQTNPAKTSGRQGNAANELTFRSLEDLLDIQGIDTALYAKLSSYLTVHSGQKLINPASAPKEVLLSIPGLTSPFVDDLLKKRGQNDQDKRNYTDAITRSDGLLALSARDIHIIYITAPWGRKGRALGKRYVIATGLDKKRPYRVLSWTDYRG